MAYQRWRAVFLVALFGIVAGAGCAKRPVTSQATAPPPTGQVIAAPAAPAQPPGPPAAVAREPVAPPAFPAPAPPPSSAPAAPEPVAPAPAVRPVAPATPVKPSEFAESPALRDVPFDFDRYNIRPDAARTLDASAAWLREHPEMLVLIEGHCDERGTNEYNLALGERRARATMSYLAARGIQASRITIISYGEERPTCTARAESCWAKNRRAHFLAKPR